MLESHGGSRNDLGLRTEGMKVAVGGTAMATGFAASPRNCGVQRTKPDTCDSGLRRNDDHCSSQEIRETKPHHHHHPSRELLQTELNP